MYIYFKAVIYLPECSSRKKYYFADCRAPFCEHGTSCFYAPPDGYDWEAGRAECQSLGGDLVMIKTAQKYQEVKEYLDERWTGCIGN